MGLLQYDDSLSLAGYTLFTPMRTGYTYLIDNYGRIVNTWESEYPASSSVYLLRNGHLLRTTGFDDGPNTGGGVQEFAWDGTLLWEYESFGEGYKQHHDLEYLPNGNVLLLARETISGTQALANGRDPAILTSGNLTPDYIVEIEPDGMGGGNIVWEWHAWDHLVQDFDSTKSNYGNVAEHPELIDLNYTDNGIADWLHCNGIAYNPELDQIIISVHQFGELWILDHSTSLAEAAGHTGGNSGMGGDLLYRWGNPRTYRAGTVDDQILFHQHNPHWIEPGLPGEGHILIFNNGTGRPTGNYSSIEEMIPAIDQDGYYIRPNVGEPYGPGSPVWTYTAANPFTFFSNAISGVQRLPNGNTLICSGMSGLFFEITSEGEKVWEYKNPMTTSGPGTQGESILPFSNMVFRCLRYAPGYDGLDGIEINPQAAIEIYPINVAATSHQPEFPTSADSVFVSARIYSERNLDSNLLFYSAGKGYVQTAMFDDGNHHDQAAGDSIYGGVIPPSAGGSMVDYYLHIVNDGGDEVNDPSIAPEASFSYTVDAAYLCGDANSDDDVNVSDAVTIINFVFVSGNPPDPIESGDANCDGDVNVSDAVWIINFVFVNGNAPCDMDGDTVPDC